MSRSDAPRGDVVVYQSSDGQVRVDVRLEQDTVWLSLDQIAALFGRHKSVISRHLRNVFSTGELDRPSVVAKSASTATRPTANSIHGRSRPHAAFP